MGVGGALGGVGREAWSAPAWDSVAVDNHVRKRGGANANANQVTSEATLAVVR